MIYSQYGPELSAYVWTVRVVDSDGDHWEVISQWGEFSKPVYIRPEGEEEWTLVDTLDKCRGNAMGALDLHARRTGMDCEAVEVLEV